MELVLNPVEERVLGCLIEKSMATPEYYPLTLNGLVNACNQKSNRYPVLTIDESTAEQALYELRVEHHLATEVTVAGSRVPKYRHNLAAHWNFSPAKTAILCELLIRGPQTPGDLRAHASRLHPLADAREVEEILTGLESHEQGPFVVQLPRESGKRECRWAHLFAGDPDLTQPQQLPDAGNTPPSPDRILELENEVTALRSELTDLRQAFDAFKANFE